MKTPRSDVRDEARLFFLCAGPRDMDGEIASLASRSLDWRVVTRLAVAARAVPVVAKRIGSALGGGLPSAAAPLGRLAMVEEFELARMDERLSETLEAFDRSGVPAVLLKGAALARSVFESFGNRPMLDLDVLVPAEHVVSAREAALSAGWVWRHDARYAPFFSTHHHLPPLVDGRGTRALLELHTGLFPHRHPFALNAEDTASRAVRLSRGGREFLVPAAEDHVVYLCAHWMWWHMMNGGAWRAHCDVGALAERGGLNWERTVRRAREARAATCVYWTLRLARAMAGVQVPAVVLERLSPPTAKPALTRLELHFASELTGGRACPSVTLTRMLWSLAVRPDWSDHGSARPWKNSEVAVWREPGPREAASRGRRLVESLGFALALARM